MCKYGFFLVGAALMGFMTVAFVQGQPGAKGKGGGIFGGGGGGNSPINLFNNADVKKALDITDDQSDKLQAEIMVAIGKVLDEKQFKRFKQIDLQKKGNNAFKDKAVQKQLKMSEEQAKNIESVLEDSGKEVAELFKGGKGGFGKGNAEKLENIRKEAKEKIMTVLTKDQRSAWRDMVGEEFKFTPFTFPGGGGKGKNDPKKDNE